MTPQENASAALAMWQQLKRRYRDPGDRMDALMREFFAPPPPCEVEYSALERTMIEEWADD